VRVAPRRTQPVTSCHELLYIGAYKTQLLVAELRNKSGCPRAFRL